MNNEDVGTKHLVREAVHETLCGLGISIDEPHEMQADFLYVRRLRKGSEFMSRSALVSVITVTVPTVLYLFWEAMKQSLGRGQ